MPLSLISVVRRTSFLWGGLILLASSTTASAQYAVEYAPAYGGYGGYQGYAEPAYAPPAYNIPGGPYGQAGSPYYYTMTGGSGYQPYDIPRGAVPADPYTYHFGPGYYRNAEAGHYRFPYYSYRRPWYFHGHPSYNRDTNLPW